MVKMDANMFLVMYLRNKWHTQQKNKTESTKQAKNEDNKTEKNTIKQEQNNTEQNNKFVDNATISFLLSQI